MPTDASPKRKTTLGQWVMIAIAIVALEFAAFALVLVIQEDDPPQPDFISAESAEETGNPVVNLGEMFIDGDLQVPVGSILTVVNVGATQHDLSVETGPKTPLLKGGQAIELDVSTQSAGSYIVYCSVEGHRQSGMEAELVIE